jgi:2-methylaconitate cis-trans-isomerase PrpF
MFAEILNIIFPFFFVLLLGYAAGRANQFDSHQVEGIGFVAPAADAPTLTGETIATSEVDLTARFLSNGQPHPALPLTASLCTGVAARIAGTLVAEALAPGATKREAIRIGMPSGILTVGAAVEQAGPNVWIAQRGSFFRTARRLFAGRLYVQLS